MPNEIETNSVWQKRCVESFSVPFQTMIILSAKKTFVFLESLLPLLSLAKVSDELSHYLDGWVTLNPNKQKENRLEKDRSFSIVAK